jgi:hypothetical protein
VAGWDLTRQLLRRTADNDSQSIFMAESLRYSHLSLTDEAYVSIHELAEFVLNHR